MINNLKLQELKQPVVVTGAFGFIGSRTIKCLIDLGATEIIAFDLPGLAMPEHWPKTVKYIAGDISVKADVEKTMNGAGTVIHLAAMVGDWTPQALHDKVTLQGSQHVFDAAIKNNTRVVLSSSIVVYADRLTEGVCSEEKTWGQSMGPYSFSKQKQELMAWDCCRDKNMLLSIVRPANVYGPGSKPWVHDMVDTLKTGAPALIDGGDFNAALVYVDNVVQLLLLAATKEAALGEVFNGADGNQTSWKTYMLDIAEELQLSTPKSIPLWFVKPAATLMETVWRLFNIKQRPPLTREALNLVGGGAYVPITKAQKLLGYDPQVNYEEGIKQVRSYIKKNLMS